MMIAKMTTTIAYAARLTTESRAKMLCVLDAAGRLRERVQVATSSHDACLAPRS